MNGIQRRLRTADGYQQRTPSPAEEDQPASQGQDDRSSLKGESDRDAEADADGQATVPPPRGEESSSDKKAGAAR
jgi:hypothetical protein